MNFFFSPLSSKITEEVGPVVKAVFRYYFVSDLVFGGVSMTYKLRDQWF